MMRLHKAYHRLSILTLCPLTLTLSPHLLSLKPLQFSSVCNHPLRLRARPSRRHAVTSVRTSVTMASSRLRNLVPVNAVVAEDAAADGSNGSVSSSTNATAIEDEGSLTEISIIDHSFYQCFVICFFFPEAANKVLKCLTGFGLLVIYVWCWRPI